LPLCDLTGMVLYPRFKLSGAQEWERSCLAGHKALDGRRSLDRFCWRGARRNGTPGRTILNKVSNHDMVKKNGGTDYRLKMRMEAQVDISLNVFQKVVDTLIAYCKELGGRALEV
jgi:hypothetical protein